jgi:hypothetical protein
MHGMKNVKLGYAQQASPIYHFKNIKENYYKKVKQSRYRPGVAQRFPGSEGSQIT